MSIANKEIKFIKSLQSKKGRKLSRKFSAEGVRLVEESLRQKFYPETIFYSESLLSERGKKVIEGFKRTKTTLNSISSANFQSISDTKTPQGILGIYKHPQKILNELYWPKHRKLLLCENISDPGNLGTLIRSAAAFEFDLVVLVGDCADAYSPKTVRSSAGGVFSLTVAESEIEEILGFVAYEKIVLIAADVRGKPGKMPTHVKKGKFMLAIGSESEGLSEIVLKKAVINSRIDHSRKVESLNAAVAGSILMNKLFGR